MRPSRKSRETRRDSNSGPVEFLQFERSINLFFEPKFCSRAMFCSFFLHLKLRDVSRFGRFVVDFKEALPDFVGKIERSRNYESPVYLSLLSWLIIMVICVSL